MLKEDAQKKLQVQHIIKILEGVDLLSGITGKIQLELSDEAVYEHLKTCATVVDDEETKRKLYDFAELFSFEFCNEK